MKAGEILVFTSGAYSDYIIIKIAKCLKEFNNAEQAINSKCYREAKRERSGDYSLESFRKSEFLKYLVAQGFIEILTYEEIYLADYSDFEVLKADYERIAGDGREIIS